MRHWTGNRTSPSPSPSSVVCGGSKSSRKSEPTNNDDRKALLVLSSLCGVRSLSLSFFHSHAHLSVEVALGRFVLRLRRVLSLSFKFFCSFRCLFVFYARSRFWCVAFMFFSCGLWGLSRRRVQHTNKHTHTRAYHLCSSCLHALYSCFLFVCAVRR